MPKTNIALVSLGSNLEPERNITQALAILAEEFTLVKQARWLKTKPVDVQGEQPDFINTGCLLHTRLGREELRRRLKQIEAQLGRQPFSSAAPRTIDLDLAVWEGEIVDQDVYRRDFLRQIVAELMPNLSIN